jgi:hypothetical protein
LKGRTWEFYQYARQIKVENGPKHDLALEYKVPCSNPDCPVITIITQILYRRQEDEDDNRYDAMRGSRSETITGLCAASDPEFIKNKLIEQSQHLNSSSRLKRELAKIAIRRLQEEFGIDVTSYAKHIFFRFGQILTG